MALTANFIADFSSFLDATRESIAAMQGFKESAEELGPATDRSLEEQSKAWEQVGRQIRRVGDDALGAANVFIQAYAEEEEATARLVAALEAQGTASDAVKGQYADMAAEFQRATTQADDALIQAQATLTTIGKIGPENMRLALEATTNLAAGMRIDLAQAAKLVAEGFATGGENLGRLQKVFEGTNVQIESGTDLLTALNNQFAGQAAAQVETYTGSMANLNNQMEDFRGAIGEELVGVLQSMLAVFQALPEPVQSFTVGVVAIGTALAPVLVSLASLASLLSTPIVAGGLSAALSAILPFLGPAGLIAVGVVAAIAVWKNWDTVVGWVKAVYDGVKYYLVEGIKALVAPIQKSVEMVAGAFKWLKDVTVGHSYVPEMTSLVIDYFNAMAHEMVWSTQAGMGVMNDLWKQYQGTFGGIGSIGVSSSAPAPDFASWAMSKASYINFGKKAEGGGYGGGGGLPSFAPAPPVNITVNLEGLLATTDPQGKAALKQAVGDALMTGMRQSRLMGTA